MEKAKLSLRPSETSTIIRAEIEGLTVPQLMLFDQLVSRGVPQAVAKEVVTGVGVYSQVISAGERQEAFIASMIAKGFKESVVRGVFGKINSLVDSALKEEFPDAEVISVPLPEHLEHVIGLCSSGMTWNDACKKASSEQA